MRKFMNALVGYTGFVGGNICAAGKFEGLYNSKNIEEAYGTRPEFLVYAGLRAEKYLANSAPEKDMELIFQAEENIRRIDPKKLVLISTIDVFKSPVGVNEASEIETEGLQAYGYDRYQLECWVRREYPDALIIRLPGLFGKGIKKNFIYDYIHVVPFMLKENKFEELAGREPELRNVYTRQDNGFYRLQASEEEKKNLKGTFRRLGFTALNFTDSRSSYQFYDLSRLWTDIQKALELGLRLWHPATEPVTAGEVYRYLTGQEFCNELGGTPAVYDYRTVFDHEFGGRDGYMMDKETVLQAVQAFVSRETSR